MTDLQFPRFARTTPPPGILETTEAGGRSYFAHDVEPVVMQACRARGLGFDLFATRFNVPRATLLEILRGNEPVSTHTRRILEDFVARSLGSGHVAYMAATQSRLATRDRL